MKISRLYLALFCYILLVATANSFRSLSDEPSPSPTTHGIPHPDLATIFGHLEHWEFYIEEIIETATEATIFVPIGLAHKNHTPYPLFLDPFEVFYHVIPHAYSSHHLKAFSNGTRFPTLIEDKSILVTSNNNGSNFTIDGVPITLPDIFYNGIIAFHGLPSPLDYRVYGGHAREPLPPFPSPPSFPPPPSPSPQPSPAPSSPPSPPANAPALMPASPRTSPPPQHLPPKSAPAASPRTSPPPQHLPPKSAPAASPRTSPPPQHLPPKSAPAAPQPSQRSAALAPPCPDGTCSADSSNAQMLASKFATTILAICSMVMGFQILS